MKKEFYTSPLFIACGIIIISYFLPYTKYSESWGNLTATGFSLTKNEMNLTDYSGRKNVENTINLADAAGLPVVSALSPFYRLTFLIPLLALLTGFFLYKGDSKHEKKLRLGLVILCGLLFVSTIYVVSSENKASIGFGAWLTLLTGIFIQFETAIIKKLDESGFLSKLNIQESNSNSTGNNKISVNKKLALIFAAVSLIAIFLPWLNANSSASIMGQNASFTTSVNGINTTLGILSLIVTVGGIFLVSKGHKQTYLSGVINVVLGLYILMFYNPSYSANTNSNYGSASASASLDAEYGLYIFLLSSALFFLATQSFFKTPLHSTQNQ